MNNIRLYRNKFKYSLRDLAKITGINNSTLSKVEQGHTRLNNEDFVEAKHFLQPLSEGEGVFSFEDENNQFDVLPIQKQFLQQFIKINHNNIVICLIDGDSGT